MTIPFFFAAEAGSNDSALTLDEDNSRHAVSVLRMKEGEQLYLTNGKGTLLAASITEAHKKKCRIAITGIEQTAKPEPSTAIGISLVKNPVRFEWFLEKATEIGITEIFPLLCQRTEKLHIRPSRLQQVLVSALLQSRQTWLPVLHAPITPQQLMSTVSYAQQFIAHCIDS
ncbi:MAG TPA: RsmE family RNA methyltransferase, partial [Chitinophagaceae bacterium]|nr:RsmE family RNA methyltransferase [Chitinophagaceae bacterium]